MHNFSPQHTAQSKRLVFNAHTPRTAPPASMHELLFRAWVWALGLTNIGALIYGLAAFPPDTITQHMIDSVLYRIVLSSCMVFQVIIWSVCVYAKRDNRRGWIAELALFLLNVVMATWIALTSILTTQVHIILVYICMSTFIAFIAIMCYLSGPGHTTAVIVLEGCLALLCCTGISMIALYSYASFYIPEHIGMFVNSAVFVLFFTVHTYRHWAERDEAEERAHPDVITVEMVHYFDAPWHPSRLLLTP